MRREAHPREAQEIAAVGNHDRLLVELALDRREQPVGMHATVATRWCRAHRLPELGNPLQVPGAHGLRPASIRSGYASRGRVDDRIERQRGIAQDLDRSAPVVAKLRRHVGDAHEAGGAEDRRRAVRELKVEAPAQRDDEVRLAHRRAAHRADDRRMLVGDDATALARVEIERTEAVEEALEGCPRPAGAAPADHQRPSRRPQQLDSGGYGGSIRVQHRQRPGTEMLIEQ